MEEDLKVLESYLNTYDKRFVTKNRLRFLNAIENLIARNKELELEKELNSVKEIYYTQKEIETDYIPKSKVKDKIEEYNKIRQMTKDNEIYTRMVDYMDVLQEILEGDK